MKVKNVCLKFKDLHPGRTFYLTEPGMPVVKVMVTGHSSSNLEYQTVAWSTEGKLPQMRGTVLTPEQLVEKVPFLKDQVDTYMTIHKHKLMAAPFGCSVAPPMAVLTDHKDRQEHVHVKVIDVDTAKLEHGAAVAIAIGFEFPMIKWQFKPDESCTRAFKKLSQARRYSEFPDSYVVGRESMFKRSEGDECQE